MENKIFEEIYEFVKNDKSAKHICQYGHTSGSSYFPPVCFWQNDLTIDWDTKDKRTILPLMKKLLKKFSNLGLYFVFNTYDGSCSPQLCVYRYLGETKMTENIIEIDKRCIRAY